MIMEKFIGVVIQNPKTGMFLGYFHEMPGFMAQGETHEEVNDKLSKVWSQYQKEVSNKGFELREFA